MSHICTRPRGAEQSFFISLKKVGNEKYKNKIFIISHPVCEVRFCLTRSYFNTEVINYAWIYLKVLQGRAYFNTEVINYAWIHLKVLQGRAYFNTEVINYA